jgi:5-methylcytosine-specific restriction endonuclease McrA
MTARPLEKPEHAARHCLEHAPYRMIVYARTDGHGTPLFLVAGSDRPATGAKKALRDAHGIHGGLCFYCKKKIPESELTIDHVEPAARGGKPLLHNLVVAHKGCNSDKGHKVIEDYEADAGREWLSAMLRQIRDRLNRL